MMSKHCWGCLDMNILMRSIISALAVLFVSSPAYAQSACAPLLDFEVKTLVDHKPVRLCDAYQGKVLLVVNTASKCGYTPQYEGLEKLYSKHKDQGLVVLGFPSNDFAGQEPGSEKAVQNFCRLTYGVEFPMFSKSSVKRGSASPFYNALAQEAGTYPGWNFHKYLVGRDGSLIASFPSNVRPESAEITSAIERELSK